MIDQLYLEYVEANTYESVKFSGDSKPLGVNCTKIIDGTEVSCVVKLRADLPYQEHSCAREAIGSMIACFLGIRIPQPFVVHISEEFAHSLVDDEIEARCLRSTGENFGSKTIEKDYFPFSYVTKDRYQEALEIFSFDALIQNSDRTNVKNNLYQNSRGFTIIDHEKAFPFTKPFGLIGGFPEPYDLIDPRFNFLREHLVYKYIRKEPSLNFEEIQEKVDALNESIIDTMISRLPESWQSEEINIIRNHILQVSLHSDRFVRNLREFLG